MWVCARVLVYICVCVFAFVSTLPHHQTTIVILSPCNLYVSQNKRKEKNDRTITRLKIQVLRAICSTNPLKAKLKHGRNPMNETKDRIWEAMVTLLGWGRLNLQSYAFHFPYQSNRNNTFLLIQFYLILVFSITKFILNWFQNYICIAQSTIVITCLN